VLLSVCLELKRATQLDQRLLLAQLPIVALFLGMALLPLVFLVLGAQQTATKSQPCGTHGKRRLACFEACLNE
jgi:hypothetical protein